jgi:N-carbamoyl-D-amino-acid hydrolase
MSRVLIVAAAQLGPIQMADGREVAIGRMIRLMEQAPSSWRTACGFPRAGTHHAREDCGPGNQLG